MRSFLFLGLALAACRRDPVDPTTPAPGVPTQLQFETGQDQVGTVHTALPITLGLKVADARGVAVPAQLVDWLVTKGGGSVSLTATSTDRNGEATNHWTLGDTAGTQSLEARVIRSGIPIVIERLDATAQPGPLLASHFRIHSIQIIEGDTTSTLVDGVDAYGNAVAGDTVSYLDGVGAYGHSLFQAFQFGRVRFTVPGDTMTIYVRPQLSSLSGVYSNPLSPISYLEAAALSWDSLSARDPAAHDCSIGTPQTGPDWASWGGVNFLARRADNPDSVQAATSYASYVLCLDLKASVPKWWTYYFYPDVLDGPVESHLTRLHPVEVGLDSLVFSSGSELNDTLVVHR